MARTNEFRIVSRRRGAATAGEVAAVPTDAASFTRRWGDVHLARSGIAPGDAAGIGRRG